MIEVEKKGIGRVKVGLILCAVLVVILAVSNVWSFMMVGSLQNQVDILETDKNALQSQVTNLQSEYVALNASYATLNANYNEMLMRFTNLSTDYANLITLFGLLQEDYSTLTENYNALSQSYTTLQEQYFALNALYQQLQTDYETLENAYNTLLEQHETLWNEPLEYVLTPTWDEVIAWLETDQTNVVSYDPEKFLCGDFSIMLIQHAKAMHWRMLFTVLEFDYHDENPTGIERHHGNYAHAFVSIFTTEGIVYIEPQTDYTWYLYQSGDPETHIEFSDWVFVDFGENWFGHIFVQYYNRMGANIEPIKDSHASIEVGFSH